MSFTPLFYLMGGGNTHLGTTYCHHISIPVSAAIGVVNQRFQKFSFISSSTSSVPSICSYCAINVVINVCHISLIDSAGGCLFVENTLVHLAVYMLHMIMGASNIHISPIFCFWALIVGALLSVINQIVPFSPLYIALHVLSNFSTSSSRQFQQACSHLRVNELEAWHCNRNALPHTIIASRHSHRQWEMLYSCSHALHLGSTLGPLAHVPIGKALICKISHKHNVILQLPFSCHIIFQNWS